MFKFVPAVQRLSSLMGKVRNIFDLEFLIEAVCDFTPLIYALRYDSEEMITLLRHYKVTLGKASPERIEAWVVGDQQQATQQTLNKFKEHLALANSL
ncbi:MAG: hypothetical protein K0M45_01825 [Candidatus Paracaedibacteraceae bacterium]|nr:hypothetical protein [Candidatus Paracaedibacteraceae bacterium]